MPAPIKWSAADFELVNAENPEGHPWLSAAPDGRFSLMFFETLAGPPVHTDLEERVYDAAGASPASIGTTFSSSTIEKQPASAYMADGRRIIVWTETPTAGGGNLEDVYATVYYGNNVIDLPRFLVSGGAGTQLDPVVAASDLGFAVAMNDGSVAGGRLILKFYNIAGTLINTVNAPDAPEGVNQTGFGEHRDVEITALANGNYVVTWADHLQFDIFARVFSPGGIALSGIIDVEPGGAQATFPDVTELADGRFAVTYVQYGINTLRGHIFEADGTSAGSPFTIATNAINALQQQAQTAALHDGRFITVWVRSNGNIEGQVMKADGTPDGVAFTVNGDAAGDKGRPTIATLSDGRFVVSWESGVGAAKTIFSTIFDPREAALNASASSFDDDWHGTGLADRVYMGAGNDAIDGVGGNDDLRGEAGNDILTGGDGDDQLNGGAGIDSMTGGAGNDIYFVNATGETTVELAGPGIDTVRSTVSHALATNVEKLYLDGTAANGTGNALVNFIFGNAGANVIDGLIGADRLSGLGGNDQYIVDSSGDIIFETIAGAAGGIKDSVLSSVNHTLSANVEDLTLTGAANINAAGNTLANIIGGNAGNNFIDGKGGNDTLTGGGGNDQFLFTTALNAATNVDTISDFDAANDFLRLDDAIFTQIATGYLAAGAFATGAAATTAAHRIVYNAATGDVFYDSDGVGGAAQVRFADLAGNPVLAAGDIFVF